MKTIILTLSLLIAGVTISAAQCDKKVILNTIKTEHLDANGVLQRTADDETATVEISKTDVSINVNDQHQMAGKIKSQICDWKTPFKDGQSVIKATLTDDNGDKNVTITITGKDGKISLLFEIEGEPNDRIRVTVNKFEEAK